MVLQKRRCLWIRYFLLLMLCHLPYWIWLYPCCMYGDTNSSIEQYMGFPDLSVRLATADPTIQFCNHIPFFQTLLYGWTFELGNLIGSQNMAFFGFVLLQSAAYAYILAHLLILLKRHGLSRRWMLFLTGCYALFPVYSVWMTAVVKDSLFSLLTLALTYLLLVIGITKGRMLHYWRFNLQLTVTLFVYMLCKSQCFYLVIMLLIFIAWLYGRKQPRLFIPFLGALLLFQVGWIHGVLPSCRVVPVGKQEFLGTMFQQTARYVTDHPHDVTPAEKQIIDAVLPFDSLSLLYNPTLQDPVKFNYRRDAPEKAYRAYFRIWWEQGLKHPISYLRAITDCCDAYFYPSGRYPICYPSLVTNNAEFPGLYTMEPLVPRTHSGFSAVLRIPILSLLFDMGFYNWILIALLVYIGIRRNRQAALVCFPGLLSLLVLIPSPMNGCFRYVMPIVWALPLYLACIPLFIQKTNTGKAR